MDPQEQNPNEHTDVSPAIPLEISADLAVRVDAILQDFAEGAELETALVVERSGALVSGISSEAEVMVDIISALVAGASAAMNALVRELGSPGNIESFHQSNERAVYLAEVMDRFVLVGVSTVPVPVGVVREKARQVRPGLAKLLEGIKVVPPLEEHHVHPQSLRSLTGDSISPAPDASTYAQDVDVPSHTDESAASGTEVEKGNLDDDYPEMIFEEDSSEQVTETGAESELEQPKEVIEFLDDGSPEVVIEDSTGAVIDSPFETEDESEDSEFEDEATLNESIFELEDEDEANSSETIAAAGAINDNGGEKESEVVFEIDEEEVSEESGKSPTVFEIDEDSSAFELDFDDFDDDEGEGTDPRSVGAESEAEEEEASSSGPFYF